MDGGVMTRKRIGIVSDTHGSLPQEAFELLSGQWGAERLADAVQARYRVLFDGDRAVGLEDMPRGEALESVPCDLILHAGDIGVQSALDELSAIARTVAVLGNNDFAPYWCSDGDVPAFRALTCDGVGIAMMHIPSELRCALHGRPPTVLPAVDALPQLAVHGHTHIPEVALDGAAVVVCPGSPTRSRRGSGHNAALVDIGDGRVQSVSIVRLP